MIERILNKLAQMLIKWILDRNADKVTAVEKLLEQYPDILNATAQRRLKE